jgi:hypothetical protein
VLASDVVPMLVGGLGAGGAGPHSPAEGGNAPR